MCSVSRFKLRLPQCNVPVVFNGMSGRLSGFPSLYCRYLCISGENNIFHITNFNATYSFVLCCINIMDYNRLTFHTREHFHR